MDEHHDVHPRRMPRADNDLLFWSFDGLFRSNEEMTDFEAIDDDTPIGKEKISQVI